MDFRERMKQGPVLCGQGYLFELERRGYLKAGAYVPEVVLDHPEAVRQLHREFLRAGSDIMEALTFYAHRDKLRQVGREGELERFNRAALSMAREVAEEGGALVAGNICNTWVYDPDDPATFDRVRAMYREQVQWAKDEGADLVIAETIDYLGEARLALETTREFGLPAVVTLAPYYEQTRDGHSWEEACRILEDEGADVVGLNCGRGPETMLPILERIRSTVEGTVAALPVPYRTTEQQPTFQQLRDAEGRQAFPVNLDPFLLDRDEMAAFAVAAGRLGIDYLGICCGAAPHYLRAMAEALGREVPASRYSPNLSEHAMLGGDAEVKKHNRPYREWWTD